MIIQRFQDTFIGMYDFAVTGGAIGSYDLHIPVPANYVIEEFYVISAIIPVGAGASISFDIINNSVNPSVVTIGGLCAAVQVAAFSTLNGGYFGIFGPGFNYSVTYPVVAYTIQKGVNKITYPFSIGMSISGGALTAGRLQVVCKGTGFDF